MRDTFSHAELTQRFRDFPLDLFTVTTNGIGVLFQHAAKTMTFSAVWISR